MVAATEDKYPPFDADAFATDQKQFVAFAVNNFGNGEHPYANEDTLRYFTPPYVRECVQKAIDSDKITEAAVTVGKSVLEHMK